MRRTLAGLLLWSFAACSNTTERLDLERDTVSLYGREYTWVPVRIVRADGELAATDIGLFPQDRSIVRTSGHAVACLREGLTDVEVRVRELRASFIVDCRFATRVAVESHLELEPDAEPQPLVADVIFSSGDSQRVRAVGIRSSDSAVVAIRDGMVVPRAVGFAGLSVDYGGVRTRLSVHVQRTVFDGTVALTAGGSRRWSLGEGRFTISVQPTSRDDLNQLSMETEGLNCARDPRDGDLIHCVGSIGAEAILVRRTGLDAVGMGSARVRILQIS